MGPVDKKLSDRKDLTQLSKIYMLKQLREKYGNVDLATLLKEIKGKNVHKCPNCKGIGSVTEIKTISGYDGDMPVDETYTCNTCKGFGYTEEEKKPKLIQDGWE